MTTSKRCFALIPCAGVGARAGVAGPKQYAQVAGRAVVAHTLRALHAARGLAQSLVVLSPDDEQFEAAAPDAKNVWITRTGGATRAASVAAGLQALMERGAQTSDWVLVHDAARCLVTAADVERLMAECQHDAVGGLLALPLADTLKSATPEGRVAQTLDRAGKWLAQTPQMFRLGLLREALTAAGDQVTDEASAIEALGLQPKLVKGHPDNFKLTWPEDFARAAVILEHRQHHPS
jgi:2-C-methyl-D-erythritol 4-phosphate cytidylyltransferase